ncbi:uncharacterized protein LOC135376386 [Ornithodoros turicata]|uniref:uncharacterized protein LOC135376386 n=1 Tax=Ornithodoros turicata TaxID=34597 RepID=UPI003138AF06
MTTVRTNKSELELHKLLERAVLTSYYDKFIEIGGDNVQQLRDSSDQDIEELINIVDMARKPPHVKRFKKTLAEWKPDTVAATSTPADEAEGELHKLLRGADLLSYHDKFMEIGGDNVQQLRDSVGNNFQEVIDLVDMARKPYHVKRLRKALSQWTGPSVKLTSTAAHESEGELHELLRRADLLSYHDKFIEQGADNVQRLCDSTDEEFHTLAEHVGMARKPLHVKRLKNALKQWSGHAAVMTSIPSNESEREVHELLQRADLLAYYDKFIEKGVDNVQQLFDSTEEEFLEFMDLVGMAGFPFHVMRFQNELEQWTGHPGVPRSFSRRMASASVPDLHIERSEQWKEVRKEMHRAIVDRDETRVLKCLDAVPALKLWLDPDEDVSARYKAIEEKAFRIHGLLVSRECRLKDTGESSCYEGLTPLGRAEIRRQRYYTTECVDSYIDYLKSKSRSVTRCDDFNERLEKMFKHLSSDELNRNILKVAATAPHLQVLFDFNSESVQRTTGRSNKGEVGLTFCNKQRVFVGASTTEAETCGTLIHELCDMALRLVYNNDGMPYFRGDTEREQQYGAILNDIKGRKHGLDRLIKLALSDDEEQELIVRIPHILAQYGCDDRNRVLEREVPELRKFFQEHVIPDMREYIQNVIPSVEAEQIERENARLNKALNTGNLKVEFEKPINRSLWEKGSLHIVTGPELRLLEIMVHNSVQSTGRPYLFFEEHENYPTLDCDVLVKNKCAFVLVTVRNVTHFIETLRFLSDVSRVTGTKVILLVEDSEKKNLIKKVQEGALFSGVHEDHRIDEASFEHVTNCCKNEVFENSRVKLQGQYVSLLPEAMNIDTFLQCVDTAVFLKLCESEGIELGPPLHELEERVQNYYVERECRRVVEINLKECNLDDDSEAFALLGCPHNQVATLLPHGCVAKAEEELTKFEKFVLLQEPRDYEALLEDGHFQDKVVHLLKFEGPRKRLLWTKSNGRLSHLPMTGSDCYTEDELLNVNEKVVIVSAAPGMGKTVLASRLCTELKTQQDTRTRQDNTDKTRQNSHKKRWVLYVDLPQRMALVKSASPSLGYLADLCQVGKDGLEFAFFEESLKNGSPFEVVVMLDGFDEVNEECRECVVELVQFLANKKVYKVYLLTRTVFKPHVQDTLHTVSYDLVPFSNENQNEFLTRYRAQRETPATSNEAFVQKIQQLYATLKEKNKTILETPLLLRMMAEMESGEITKSDDYSSLLKIVDISGGSSIYTVHIYKTFVEYKHLVHRKEKVKEDIYRSAVRGDNHDAKSPFYVNHGLLAMKCIFPQDTLEILLNEDELDQLDPEGSFITGVDSFKEGSVNRINERGIPEFVHKTFAEFFAAHYLLETAKGRKRLSFRKYVVGLYGEADYGAVMMLFDGLASASYPLHSAVMNNDDSYFEQRVIGIEDMLNVDELKRTPLHVAALHSDKATLKRLPMDDELIRDDLFRMSPFGYAELSCPWEEKYNGTWWALPLTQTSAARDRLDLLCARCSEEAVKRSTENLRSCGTFEEKTRFLERAIFTAVIHDLRSVLDVYLTYVSPRESIRELDRDSVEHLESRKKRSLRCSAESSVIKNLDDFVDRLNRTVPFYANSEAVCKMLLPYCDMEIRDILGNTMLHISANEGNLETTKFHLAHSSVNATNAYLQTPLQLSRDPEVVKLLLTGSPSANALDDRQEIPMDRRIMWSYLEAAISLLLRIQWNTVLHVTSEFGPLNAVVVFLPHIRAHVLNCDGKTHLDVAWEGFSEISSRLDVVRCLIPHSLVNSPETIGSSPLYVWAKGGQRKVLQTLWPYLRHSDPKHAQRISTDSVCVRVNKDFQEEVWCLKLLLLQLDVVAGDPYSRRLLHDTVVQKLCCIAEANYMKLVLPHSNLWGPGTWLAENDDLVALFQRWSDMNNPDDPRFDDANTQILEDVGNAKFLTGAREGNVEAVELHLSHSSVCFTDELDNTALHLSASNGHTNVVKLLIPFYTPVDVINVHRETPMHVCASNGHLDVVKLLLPRSRMNSFDIDGGTPLHVACDEGVLDIVNFLLPHSFASMRDCNGKTCCFRSAEKQKLKVLRCLIPHSLVNCPNSEGDSPTKLCAKYHKKEELMTLLPYSWDYEVTTLLTSSMFLVYECGMDLGRMFLLKLVVLHSDVCAVDVCYREILDIIRESYAKTKPNLLLGETEAERRHRRTQVLKDISVLFPHTNISAKDDEGKELLQKVLESSQDHELHRCLQKWTRLNDVYSYDDHDC